MVHKYVDKKRDKKRRFSHSQLKLHSTGQISSSKTSLDKLSPPSRSISHDAHSSQLNHSPISDQVFVVDVQNDHRDSGFGGGSTPSPSSSLPLTPSSLKDVPTPSSLKDVPTRFLFPSSSFTSDPSDQPPSLPQDISISDVRQQYSSTENSDVVSKYFDDFFGF